MIFPTPDQVQSSLESDVLAPLVEKLRVAILAEFRNKVGPTYTIDIGRVLTGTDPTLASAAFTQIKAQLAAAGWTAKYESSQRDGAYVNIQSAR